MSNTKDQDGVRTTDIAPMAKKVKTPVKVKINRDAAPGHARITSKDGKVDMMVPTVMVDRKFANPRMRVAFFNAHFTSTVGSLEIDDRVDLPEEKRW